MIPIVKAGTEYFMIFKIYFIKLINMLYYVSINLPGILALLISL